MSPESSVSVSVIIPAKNEAASLPSLLQDLQKEQPDAEIIVVNDGSTDDTSGICARFGVREVRHPVSRGNGAAIKSGARAANGETLVFMDADGQHRPGEIQKLLDELAQGHDMVVGVRERKSQANHTRSLGNFIYNKLASWLVGQKIGDLTSGFRAANARKFRQFLYLLPNGFSYPTSSTMAFFRSGYSVGYIDVRVDKREGTSHLGILKDGARFFLIIFKMGTLYSPFKIFLPASLFFFLLGAGHYAYTFMVSNRFTNMSALLFITAVLIFFMSLIAEQVTALMYRNSDD